MSKTLLVLTISILQPLILFGTYAIIKTKIRNRNLYKKLNSDKGKKLYNSLPKEQKNMIDEFKKSYTKGK